MRNGMVVALIALGYLYVTAAAGAGEKPPRTALVFGADDRESLSHADIYDFKSVGVVVAGRSLGVGTLLARGDIVVTAAHVVFDRTGAARARRVVFLPDGASVKAVAVDLARSRAGNRRAGPGNLADDWAILALDEDVLAANTNQGFETMPLMPVEPDAIARDGGAIVHVSFLFGKSRYRKLINRRCRFYPKQPGDRLWDSPQTLLHDCDLPRPDNSGSPIFAERGGRHHLVALHQGGHHDWHGAPFDPRRNPQFALALDDSFAAALDRYLAEHPPRQAARQ
ncbi:MAG: serine protease [Alphaproteobacteria bacterium]|jgi:hypothetical protein|nr:serine protease [Alphaproteobacteria bacterium]